MYNCLKKCFCHVQQVVCVSWKIKKVPAVTKYLYNYILCESNSDLDVPNIWSLNLKTVVKPTDDDDDDNDDRLQTNHDSLAHYRAE